MTVRQAYMPGFSTGVRAWKKELREAGVPEGFVSVADRMRARARAEAKEGWRVIIEYEVARKRAGGEAFWEMSYLLTVGDGQGEREASVSCVFGPPPEGGPWDDVLASFGQNVDNCKRWASLPAEPEGAR